MIIFISIIIEIITQFYLSWYLYTPDGKSHTISQNPSKHWPVVTRRYRRGHALPFLESHEL